MTPDFLASNATTQVDSPQEKTIQPSGFSNSFDVGIARQIGVNAAIVYNHIIYWIKSNAQKGQNQIDGKTWMYETISQMSEYFGYLSEKQIKAAIKTLIDKKLLIEAYHSKNKFDRTTWYALANEEILGFQKIFSKSTKGTHAKVHNVPIQNDKRDPCIIQENNHKDNQENKDNTPPNPQNGGAAKAACVFGSFVRLKDGEYEALAEKYSKTLVDTIIEEMNDYCSASKKKGYSDYAAAIRQWIRRRKNPMPPNGFFKPQADRRTKNLDGTAVDSPADGRF